MKKVKLNLRRKSDAVLLSYSAQHMEAVTDNPNFPTLEPSAADYLALHNAYASALEECGLARQTAQEKTARKEQARAALELALTNRGRYVDLKSGGDAAKVFSANLQVRNPSVRIGPLAAPGNVQAFANGHGGELKLRWEAVRGARSHEIQISPDPKLPANWTTVGAGTGSKATLPGLESGAVCWLRVRALGAAGFSEWSAPTAKRVP